MNVGASGTMAVRTVVLIEPEELDDASRRNVSFSPPGA